jgi:hypothetical protein
MQCTRATASGLILLVSLAGLGCQSQGALVASADAAPGGGGAGGAGGGFFVPDAGTTSADARADAVAADLGSPDVPPIISACSGAPVGPAALRRLTNTQYLRTLRDLVAVAPTTPLPPEGDRDGFEERSQWVSELHVAAWNKAAEEVAAALLPGLMSLLACPGGVVDDTCARSFITSFGRRAYRHPLTAPEVDAHFRLYSQVRALGDPLDGIGAVVQLMLQSPHFLYRPEVQGRPAGGGRLALSPFEVASRLSYFLWGSMPDAVLMEAAETGKLSTPLEIAAQARRMVRDSRARSGTDDFFRQWLDIDRVLAATKDPVAFPGWSPDLAAAMREEGYRFLQQVIFDGDGKLATLLTSSEGIVNAPLAQLYGVTISGADWQRVDLGAAHRRGLLTQAWFLASQSRSDESSPVRRGLFVRDRLFCQQVPPPPPNVEDVVPRQPGVTTRERFTAHLSNPACAGCHRLIDPLGYPFENYDGIGAFRAIDNGKPIDASGELNGTDVDGPVTDALALIKRLATSGQVRGCVTQRWYELAAGRAREDVDGCVLSELERGFSASDGNLMDLMVAIASSPAFRARPSREVVGGDTTLPLITNPPDRLSVKKMILDLLATQVNQLSQRLAVPEDRVRLDQHLSGLRALERLLVP